MKNTKVEDAPGSVDLEQALEATLAEHDRILHAVHNFEAEVNTGRELLLKKQGQIELLRALIADRNRTAAHTKKAPGEKPQSAEETKPA